MAVIGHQRLAELLPSAHQLHQRVGRFARDEIEPLGRRILAQERQRVMLVREHSFERSTTFLLSEDSGTISMDWIIDHPGADIQDRGGTIQAKQLGSRLVFFIPGVGWRAPHEVKLPARPYLSAAARRIEETSSRLLEGVIARFLDGER